ncbi:MAG: T9SS type A sorting domain-containing protein [Bacteroidia bacterium]|nr:T9SS type A sorting domain-containing protein [Bacteroidia bacterium]
MKTIIFSYGLFLTGLLNVLAQPYSIGHKLITFVDASRSNRNISTEIYYPAYTNGDNVPIASGQFPVLIFGHGFLMSWDAYKNFWDTLVPLGYIMAFPKTEGSISPNHLEFGKDLRFLNEQFKIENNNPSSFFYQKISIKSSLMGHSMGGGASFLAADSYTNFTTLVNFAAANTNPSSIQAAKNVTRPLLMFIGQNDGVTPPANHQIPMFDSCSSPCKTRVTILGGGHCYFANNNFNCSFGESTTTPQPTITRAEQQRRMFYILKPYLNYMLKGSLADSVIFFSNLQNNVEINYVRQCNITTEINEHSIITNESIIYPSPFSNYIISKEEGFLIVYDLMGKVLFNNYVKKNEKINALEWYTGIYVMRLNNKRLMLIKSKE